MKFGFIGAGNMASAIIKGMTNSTYNGKEILITSKTMTSAETLAVKYGATSGSAVDAVGCDVLILAVKPHTLPSILPALEKEIAEKKPLVISIAAGKSLAYLESLLPPETAVIRVMPNINAKIGAASSGLCAGTAVSQEQKKIAMQIFETIGTVIEIEENLFGIFTVLAGSAPAFAFLYLDTLSRAAVKAGMPKQMALQIAATTLYGSAKMVLESNEHPMALLDQVCSPGGTTIEGIAALQEHGFDVALTKAFDAVLEKDKRLGDK